MTTTHSALHLARKFIAAVAVSFMAATVLTGVPAATSSADGDPGTVVSATKEYRSKVTVGVTRTKEW